MKRILSSVAAVALSAGLATAASAEPFNGPYVGVQAGWSQDDVGTPSTPAGDVTFDRSQDSLSGGLFLGYDYKISPRVVVGAEAGVQVGADDSIVRDFGSTQVTIDPERSLDLTARAGYLVNDDTLLYARGGYTNARVKTSIEDSAGIRSASANRDGWLVGGGVEHALSDNVSARVEYRYSDLGEGDGGFDRHQALFGLSYRF
jgi:outer membrane immunogenic protein